GRCSSLRRIAPRLMRRRHSGTWPSCLRRPSARSIAVIDLTVVHLSRAQFAGMLFGINFAMGVATGITMEFQFGTNWAYYSHYVGDIFGAPLALEGLM